MGKSVCLGALLLLVVCCVNNGNGAEEVGMTIPEMIESNGYTAETHTVETEDGYILDMYRIPKGKSCGDKCGKAVVFLMHCLLCNSAIWVQTGPKKGLAYVLAEQGYDVWMGNARGTTASKKHKSLNPVSDESYWEFSFHEIGYYDLPAKIDYILKKTGQENLFYIGHSQGSTVFFVMASERPEYNKKIRLMTAMAPAVYMSNMDNKLIKTIAKDIDVFVDSAKKLELKKYIPGGSLLLAGGQMLCAESSTYAPLCHNVLFLICGDSPNQLNKTSLPLYISNLNPEASGGQFLHYAQVINTGKFGKYDQGPEMNKKKFGHETAPDYDLKKVNAPVAIFHTGNDALISTKDANILKDQLPNVKLMYSVPDKQFNHLDFIWGNDVVPLLYKRVIDLLKEHS